MFNWINKTKVSKQNNPISGTNTELNYTQNILLILAPFYEDIQPGHNKVLFGEYRGETDPDITYSDLNNFDALGSNEMNAYFTWSSSVSLESGIAFWFERYLSKMFRKIVKVEYVSIGEYVFNKGRYVVVGYKIAS